MMKHPRVLFQIFFNALSLQDPSIGLIMHISCHTNDLEGKRGPEIWRRVRWLDFSE
jgi:hypothetical protein